MSLRAYADADFVQIEVEDRCGGLSQGFERTIFAAFTQGAVDRSGLGLGLSICKGIAEANRGTLTVRNLPAVGCVFSFRLPRCENPAFVAN